jgi:hypothetical protein
MIIPAGVFSKNIRVDICHLGAAGLNGCTDKKENQIFLIYREIQSGGVAKSYMR